MYAFLLFVYLLVYWVVDAFILQLSSKLIVKHKPDYQNAFGLIGLFYGITVVLTIEGFIIIMLVAGRKHLIDMLYSRGIIWFRLIPRFILYYLLGIIVVVLLTRWIYGKLLKDGKGKIIGFAKGILVFLLNLVITRAIFKQLD